MSSFALAGMLAAIAIFGMTYYTMDVFFGQSASYRNRLKIRLKGLEAKHSISIEKKAIYSDIKAFNEILEKQAPVRKLSRSLRQAGIKMSPASFILVSLLIPAVLYGILSIQEIPVIFVFLFPAISLFAVPVVFLRFMRTRYLDQFGLQFPKALQTIRGCLTAGLGLSTAFERVVQDAPYPVNLEFSYLMQQTSMGMSMVDAIGEMKKSIGTLDIQTFAVALTVQQESGGNLVELVRNLEDTINARVTIRKELKVLTAQARMSALILAMLPFMITMVIQLLNPTYLSALYTTEDGQMILGVTIFLWLFGMLALRMITNIRIAT
ncbi:MAG: hypothetical protein A2Z83_06130 [Omnitrophica bacterium GWA2_52_8]|nr:MAG: hypothetical protein A2Z83_06130 [Omnitrophica bacterium GWA2_52_8]